MKSLNLVLYLICSCHAQNYVFPEGFIFGVATASYQVEGAWNESGKGVNIWDHVTHNSPEFVDDLSNGDVACDTYHKTAEDVQLLVNLGVDFYRFSISWSRILPSGQTNKVNEDGVAYYNELIDALLENGITPLVTIFHWDLPQPLQEIGGWPSPVLINLYVEYANVLFSLFGDRVKDWITFNEPHQICFDGYSLGTLAPGYTEESTAGFLCTYTLLMSHARTYQLYNENYRDTQQGRVGITVHGAWAEAASESADDVSAAEYYMQLHFGIFLHPIFSEDGDYPPILRERIDALSAEEGYSSSRLPLFTNEEVELLRGSADFLGFNHYTTWLCSALTGDEERPSYQSDIGCVHYKSDDWEIAASTWLAVVPSGFRSLLNWIKNEYNNPEVIITENGYSDRGELNDCRRVNYYNLYLEALLQAIYEDGCNIFGYTAWSFMDNFEWRRGYTEKFGLYHVDFDDDERPRTPKMSASVFKNIIETRSIDWTYTPDGFEACDF